MYFGYWAHFILAMYCYISFLFSIYVIAVDIVNVINFVNSAAVITIKNLKSEIR